jgi:ABC-type nitrate/sulfonate/bicarbonate transport system permease component
MSDHPASPPHAASPADDGIRAEDAPPDDIEELGPPRGSQRNAIIRLVAVAVVLAGWEVFGRQIEPLFMSYPTAIGTAAVDMIRSGELPAALLDSLGTLLLAFLIASVVGVGLGLLIGRYRAVEAATDWLVNALYATPLVAIIPLVVLWLGLGFSAKLFIVAILAVFPILINTAAGVHNVPRPLLDVGFAFDATERQLFTKFILPASLPYMMTGLRLGVGRAIIGMVVAEFFTAITGLGALIVKYGNQYDTASMFVPILTLMLLGVTLTALMRRIESSIAPWKDLQGD